MKKFVVYWTCSHNARRKIQDRFSLSEYTSVNGETKCYIRDTDMELFKETAKRGFFKIRSK